MCGRDMRNANNFCGIAKDKNASLVRTGINGFSLFVRRLKFEEEKNEGNLRES